MKRIFKIGVIVLILGVILLGIGFFNNYTTIAIIIMAIVGLYFAYRWYQKRIKKT